MNRYQKVIKYTKPLVEIDEKIRHLNERMTTTGFYTVTNQDGGLDEIPPIFSPAPLGDMDPDNFSWPDQGDGNPENDPNMSSLLVTDTLGREIPLFDYLPGVTYSGWNRVPDYSLYGGKKPLAIVFDGRALASTRYFFLSEDGLNFIIQKGAYTTPGPYSDLQTEFSNWLDDIGSQLLTTETIYLWGAIDCLFGSCYGGADYYPEGTTNTSDPKATRVLYPYTMYVPGSGNRNYASDPGVRARPPRVNSIISRDDLGDPNYYPGPATNVSPEAINYLLAQAGYIPPYIGRPPRNSPGGGTQNVRGPSTPIKYYPGMGFGPAGPVQPGGFYANSYEPEGEVLSEDLTKDDFARLNKYVKDHPEELEYAFKRYPASDPRLSKLNWQMDDMMNASNEYVEKQFPENVEQTSRVKKILARNIELSDPKTFKDPKPALTYGKVFNGEPKSKKVREKDFSKKSPARFFKTEKKVDTSRTRWLKG